jgi:hypothetical protein
MTEETDPYADLKRHRMTPEILATLAVIPRKIQKRRQQFVKVPWPWIERLAKVRRAATCLVALYVLYRHWKSGGLPVTLSNIALEDLRVDRRQKWRALRELEQLGLVTVERRKRQSPRVTALIRS